MTRRLVIGRRANGNVGIFAARPGYDAYTATDDNLTMSITSAVSQLIMLSAVYSTQTIALGLSRSPYVFVTSYNNLSGVAGHTWGGGPARPSPLTSEWTSSSVVINGNGASMTVQCSIKTVFAVYGKAFT